MRRRILSSRPTGRRSSNRSPSPPATSTLRSCTEPFPCGDPFPSATRVLDGYSMSATPSGTSCPAIWSASPSRSPVARASMHAGTQRLLPGVPRISMDGLGALSGGELGGFLRPGARAVRGSHVGRAACGSGTRVGGEPERQHRQRLAHRGTPAGAGARARGAGRLGRELNLPVEFGRKASIWGGIAQLSGGRSR